MGLHSSSIERMVLYSMYFTGRGLNLTSITEQCPEMVCRWWCMQTTLCVSGQGYDVVCLCDGGETAIGCSGNEGFAWPARTAFFLSCRHLFWPLLRCIPLDMSGIFVAFWTFVGFDPFAFEIRSVKVKKTKQNHKFHHMPTS